MDKYIDFAALFQVLMVSLLAGAGLVAVYAVGLVGLSASERVQTGDGTASARRVGGLVLAVACFGLVVFGIALGLWVIIKS